MPEQRIDCRQHRNDTATYSQENAEAACFVSYRTSAACKTEDKRCSSLTVEPVEGDVEEVVVVVVEVVEDRQVAAEVAVAPI